MTGTVGLEPRIALVLTVGGARSAWQVGVLREIARFGGDVSAMVPTPVAKRLQEKYPT